MAYFPQVYKGQTFSPSVLEENNIRQSLNPALSCNDPFISNGRSVSRQTIFVINGTQNPITIYSPCAIEYGVEINEGKDVLYHIRPAKSRDKSWGVVADHLEPLQTGEMVVSGVTPAFIPTGSGQYVTPGEDGLIAANSGRGEILYNPSTTDTPGVILLGGGGNSLEYIGYFKLIHTGWETEVENNEEKRYPTFAIINGYRPEDQYCGYTDIPGHEKIPRFEFVLKDLGATITLCVYEGADENGQNNATYRVAFTIGAWNDGFTRQVIGNAYIDGKVEQAYVAGGTIYFGRDWFL